MPFDGTGFSPKREGGQPPRMSDNEASALMVIVFALLLLTPFSVAVLVDIVRYFKGG